MKSHNFFRDNPWGIVTDTDQITYIGNLSEYLVGSTGFVRIDTPVIEELRLPDERRNNLELVCSRVDATSKLIAARSIVSITPCTEDVAIKRAEAFRERKHEWLPDDEITEEEIEIIMNAESENQ